MPRYARYKRYYKKVYPRKRWASNIKSDRQTVTVTNSSNSGTASSVICQNSAPNSTPTPTILRFGRFKLKGDVRTTANNASNVTSANVFVVYIPEGVSISSDILNKHPEYIMGWTTLSMDSGNSFSVTSPLKRNLNSGDSIYVFFTIDTVSSPDATVYFNFYYTIQFWTTSA